MYRQLLTTIMGLFGLFGTRTKADIDREIASLQDDLERAKANLAINKELNKRDKNRGIVHDTYNLTYRIADIKSRIARLKAERKNAPK